GDDFTVALKNDGTVWAWGNNGNGQLGNGSSGPGNDSSTPVQALAGVATVLAGGDFAIAVKSAGTYWAWGNNTDGQFCNGATVITNSTPAQIIGMELLGLTGITAGHDHTVFIKSDTTVWACGNNLSGQLGNNNTPTPSNIPVQATGLSGVTFVAAGSQDTVAVKNDGTLWAWGNNANGQLGDKSAAPAPNRSSPVQVQF
ncbi:MAG: hypothetical protein PHN75_16230, partial [Syntrophales bacterium]|nr:hypothetical protein [Syntrophales bacterium]